MRPYLFTGIEAEALRAGAAALAGEIEEKQREAALLQQEIERLRELEHALESIWRSK